MDILSPTNDWNVTRFSGYRVRGDRILVRRWDGDDHIYHPVPTKTGYSLGRFCLNVGSNVTFYYAINDEELIIVDDVIRFCKNDVELFSMEVIVKDVAWYAYVNGVFLLRCHVHDKGWAIVARLPTGKVETAELDCVWSDILADGRVFGWRRFDVCVYDPMWDKTDWYSLPCDFRMNRLAALGVVACMDRRWPPKTVKAYSDIDIITTESNTERPLKRRRLQ